MKEKLVAEAASWAVNDAEKSEQSRVVAWRVCSAAVVLALMGWGMAAFESTRPVPPPVTVVVDQTTGNTWIAGPFDKEAIPSMSVLDQHWAEAYVHACESYTYKALQRDYDQCARMSAPRVFNAYAATYSGQDAKQNKVGDREEDTTSTVSVRTTPSTVPGRHGEAIITFDKKVHMFDGTADAVTRYVGTCEFEYHPEAMKKPIDRLENPLGFVCTNYRKDAELISPVPAASGAPRSGGAA